VGAGAARRRPSSGPVTGGSSLSSALHDKVTRIWPNGKTRPIFDPGPLPRRSARRLPPTTRLVAGGPGASRGTPGRRPPRGPRAPMAPTPGGKALGDQRPGPPGAARPLPSPTPGPARGALRRPAPGGGARAPLTRGEGAQSLCGRGEIPAQHAARRPSASAGRGRPGADLRRRT
jgi:hypothetical protein